MGKYSGAQASISTASHERYPFKPDRFSSHLLLLEEIEQEGKGRQVLDIGCGRGHLARVLVGRGYRVTGVDVDAEALLEAAKWCDEVVEEDVETWAIPSGQSYDYILIADGLEHLRDPQSILRRLLSLLREGGTVIVSVPNVAHLYVRLMLLFGRWDYSERGILDRTHLRFFTRSSFRRFLQEAGIEVRRLRATSLPWSMIWPSAPMSLTRILVFADHLCSRIRPTLFAYQWVAVGVKVGSYE